MGEGEIGPKPNHGYGTGAGTGTRTYVGWGCECICRYAWSVAGMGYIWVHMECSRYNRGQARARRGRGRGRSMGVHSKQAKQGGVCGYGQGYGHLGTVRGTTDTATDTATTTITIITTATVSHYHCCYQHRGYCSGYGYRLVRGPTQHEDPIQEFLTRHGLAQGDVPQHAVDAKCRAYGNKHSPPELRLAGG